MSLEIYAFPFFWYLCRWFLLIFISVSIVRNFLLSVSYCLCDILVNCCSNFITRLGNLDLGVSPSIFVSFFSSVCPMWLMMESSLGRPINFRRKISFDFRIHYCAML